MKIIKMNRKELTAKIFELINKRDDIIEDYKKELSNITETPVEFCNVDQVTYKTTIKPLEKTIISLSNKLLKSKMKTIKEVYSSKPLLDIYKDFKNAKNQDKPADELTL